MNRKGDKEDTDVSAEVSVSAVFRSSFPAENVTGGFRTGAWRLGVATTAEQLKPLYPTLLHAVSTAARLSPDRGITLLADDEDDPPIELTYFDLYRQARAVAGGLIKKGFKRGDRALLVFPTSAELIVAFFGVQLAGGVPVPSYPPAALEKTELGLARLKHVAQHCTARVCLASRQLVPLLGELALDVKSLRHLGTVESLLDEGAQPPKPHALSSDPAFIQYTSGSTGNPKGVLLTHKNLCSNIHAAGQASKINSNDVTVSWLPLYHDMGLIGGLLFSIYWRIPVVLMSPTAFLMQPARWLHAMSKYKATLTAAPNFAYAMAARRVRPKDREGLDLKTVRLALNGAEPVNVRSLRDFVEAFGPYGFSPSALYPVYGLAEATVAVTFPDLHEKKKGKASEIGDFVRYLVVDRAELAMGRVVEKQGQGSMAVVSVGRAVPGHEIQIVDDKGRWLRERTVGHVLVRGPSVMKGYFQDPEATDKVLRNGWLWTGDLGFHDRGELFITGRSKDMLIIRGKNFYAEDLERLAERVDGVRPGGAVAFGVYDEAKAADLAVMVCETKFDDDAKKQVLAGAISEGVATHSGLILDEVVLVPPGTIPKTSSGKRQRAGTRQLYLEGELVPKKTGKLKLALVFARSGAGLLSLFKRKLTDRREPD
ncbi:MAG: fatty acyl-AMP ligase [Myxococcaceae bacterium]|nr:fatty acyl-AMP ligase [Myxococcaceae bacterium]